MDLLQVCRLNGRYTTACIVSMSSKLFVMVGGVGVSIASTSLLSAGNFNFEFTRNLIPLGTAAVLLTQFSGQTNRRPTAAKLASY